MKNLFDGLGITIQEILIVIIPGLSGLFFLNQIPAIHSSINVTGDFASSPNVTKIVAGTFFIGYVFNVLSSFLDGLYDWLKRKKLNLERNRSDSRSDDDLEYMDLMGNMSLWKKIIFPYAKHSHNLIVKIALLKPSELRFVKNNRSQNLFDAYQYATRVLKLESPEMYEEVYHYYATARFFRSMTLVFFLGFIIKIYGVDLSFSSGLLVLCMMVSLYAFTVQWRKAQNVAFKNFIIYETRRKIVPVNNK